MKKRVVFSNYSMIISALSTAVMCGGFMYALKQTDNSWTVWILAVAIISLFICTLFFMPLSISLVGNALNIERPLKIKTIPISEISDVKRLFKNDC